LRTCTTRLCREHIFSNEQIKYIQRENLDYLISLSKSINQVHKRVSSHEKKMIQLPSKRAVESFGCFRLILVELLVTFLETEEKLKGYRSILDSIPHSTVQVLFFWALELCENNMYTNLFLRFFRLFASNCSETMMCNAMIKTGTLEMLATFYTDLIEEPKIDPLNMMYSIKPFLDELIDILDSSSFAEKKPDFVREAKLFSKWRYALYRRQ